MFIMLSRTLGARPGSCALFTFRENGKGGMTKGGIIQFKKHNNYHSNKLKTYFPITPFVIPPFSFSQCFRSWYSEASCSRP